MISGEQLVNTEELSDRNLKRDWNITATDEKQQQKHKNVDRIWITEENSSPDEKNILENYQTKFNRPGKFPTHNISLPGL